MATTTYEVTFEDLAGADEVRLADNLGTTYDEVTDPDAIRRLGGWLAEREEGWYVPRDGVVVVSLSAFFYRDGVALGSVGLGRKFLVGQLQGSFVQRDAAPGDRAEALAILGVDDPEG